MYHPAIKDDTIDDKTKRLVANEPLSLIHLDPNDYRAQEKDIQNTLKKAPDKVELFLFDAADSEGICLNNEKNNCTHVINAGKNYFKIGARIVNENGGIVLSGLIHTKKLTEAVNPTKCTCG